MRETRISRCTSFSARGWKEMTFGRVQTQRQFVAGGKSGSLRRLMLPMQHPAVKRVGHFRRFESPEVYDSQRVTHFSNADLQKCTLEIVLHVAHRGRGDKRRLNWKIKGVLTNRRTTAERPPFVTTKRRNSETAASGLLSCLRTFGLSWRSKSKKISGRRPFRSSNPGQRPGDDSRPSRRESPILQRPVSSERKLGGGLPCAPENDGPTRLMKIHGTAKTNITMDPLADYKQCVIPNHFRTTI